MGRPRKAPAATRGRNGWTREQLLLALHLYYRIPFGRQHQRAPEVIELARAIGRTPSAVAMKLNNLTAIDPAERGRVKGLPGASELDRRVWVEFHADRVPMAAESEALWMKQVGARTLNHQGVEGQGGEEPFSGPTEARRTSTVRRAQAFFRRAVLAAYGRRCCVSDVAVGELLVASHIVPWAEDEAERVNPANGLCLSRLHDGAFDGGLVTFDEEHRLVLGRGLRDHLTNQLLRDAFQRYEGCSLRLPERFAPDARFLAHHRERRFLG